MRNKLIIILAVMALGLAGCNKENNEAGSNITSEGAVNTNATVAPEMNQTLPNATAVPSVPNIDVTNNTSVPVGTPAIQPSTESNATAPAPVGSANDTTNLTAPSNPIPSPSTSNDTNVTNGGMLPTVPETQGATPSPVAPTVNDTTAPIAPITNGTNLTPPAPMPAPASGANVTPGAPETSAPNTPITQSGVVGADAASTMQAPLIPEPTTTVNASDANKIKTSVKQDAISDSLTDSSSTMDMDTSSEDNPASDMSDDGVTPVDAD